MGKKHASQYANFGWLRKTPNINAPIKQKIYLILLFPDVIFIKKEITPTTEAMVAAVVLLIFSFAIFYRQ